MLGCTHRSAIGKDGMELSAYRFHEEDPLAFSGGVKFQCVLPPAPSTPRALLLLPPRPSLPLHFCAAAACLLLLPPRPSLPLYFCAAVACARASALPHTRCSHSRTVCCGNTCCGNTAHPSAPAPAPRWRIGDLINAKAHPESPKCFIDKQGPGDEVVGRPMATTVFVRVVCL